VLGTQVNPKFLRQLVINEGFKSFLNKNVDDDNKLLLFKPYKDYCHYLAECISEIDAAYPFARSLSTTFIEMSHSMEFYKEHLPSMINIADKEHSTDVLSFLKSLTSSQLKK
jgi:hypothetical protein